MLTIFHVQNVPIIFDWCLCDFLVLKHIDEVYTLHFRLMSIWFSYTETHQWSVCTSCSFVIYWCLHIFVSKMFQNFNIVFDYLLILTIFPVQNVLIIFNWCMWFSCTETYWWSAHTSSSFVIDWCWHFCLWKIF